MNLTTEQKAELLMGDEQRAARKLPRHGFADASSADPHFQERILEIRQAIIEKRSAPPATRSYVAAAETRSALVRNVVASAKKLFHIGRPVADSIEARAKRNGLTVGQLVDAELRIQANRQAVEIRKAKHRVKHQLRDDENFCSKCGKPVEEDVEDEFDEQEEEDLRRFRSEVFPWERQS